jgi:thiosulfate/3-mercaptopyruvate sulfurtransferase
MLVSTGWLAQHLKDPNLVMLALGDPSEYEKEHIPGSLLFKYGDAIRENNGLHTELRPMSELAEIFGKLGVSNDSHVVLYMSKNWITAATRVYLTLEAMGLGPHVSILDGGLPAWKKENRPVTAETSAPKPATIQTCPQSDVITDLDYVKQNLHKPGVSILDSRLEQHWSGRETPKGSRTGHIPGANTLPFERLYDDTGKMRTAAEAESILTAAGVKKTDRVVVYCYIGQRATGLYFVLRYLGYDARLFDGSWEEWNQHTELPVEVSAAK